MAAGRTRKIHPCAVIEQDFDYLLLHAGVKGWSTGRDQAERCASTLVDVGDRVDFRPGGEQDFGDLSGVAR